MGSFLVTNEYQKIVPVRSFRKRTSARYKQGSTGHRLWTIHLSAWPTSSPNAWTTARVLRGTPWSREPLHDPESAICSRKSSTFPIMLFADRGQRSSPPWPVKP